MLKAESVEYNVDMKSVLNRYIGVLTCFQRDTKTIRYWNSTGLQIDGTSGSRNYVNNMNIDINLKPKAYQVELSYIKLCKNCNNTLHYKTIFGYIQSIVNCSIVENQKRKMFLKIN